MRERTNPLISMTEKHCQTNTHDDADDDDDDADEDDVGGWQDVLTDPYKSGAGAKASQRAPCFSN